MTVGCQPGIQIYRIVTSSNGMILSIYAVSATFKCLCTQSPLLQNTQQSQRKSSFFPLPDTGDAINNCGFMLVTVDKIGHKDRENS